MDQLRLLVDECSRLIAEHKLTIAFAESATAGKLSYEFSQTGYSGSVLRGSIVCYNSCVKEDLLHVSKELIVSYTAESQEVTKAMAYGLKKSINANILVAVTGLTTPGGSEGPGKPVGTMFYCLLVGKECLERRKVFEGTSSEIIDLTIGQICKTLMQALKD